MFVYCWLESNTRLDQIIEHALRGCFNTPVQEERNLGVKSGIVRLKCKSRSRREQEASYAIIPAKWGVGVPPKSGEHRAWEKSADEI
jgi:hypothetical protein